MQYDAVEEGMIRRSADGKGTFATGELVERYDCVEPETGDLLVMYRVPYRGVGEPRPEWATTLDKSPPLNRSQRRALKKGSFAVLAAPPNLGEDGRKLAGRLIRMLDTGKFATTGKGNEYTEQNALALLTVAAREISKLPESEHREAIIQQMGRWLGWLVQQNNSPPEQPTHVYEVPESDDDDRTN